MPEQEISWDRCMQIAAISDVGMRRSNNQDAHTEVLAGDTSTWQERGHVFVLADGMGAHAAGELASKMAAETVPHLYHKHRELSPPEAILAALRETNSEINGRGEANAEFRNMGTTCSVLVILPQGALVAHVGDSRIYRLRGDQLQQLTFDHSLVWEMRAAGQILTADDQDCAIPKNVITRSLGPHPSVQVDLEGPFPIEIGDIFLLCSDGLTGRVKDSELGALMARLEPETAARMLVDLANWRGGPDNITVIILKITGPEATTRVASTEPLTVGRDCHVERNVHPVIWIAMGVLLLASPLMALAHYPITAAVFLVCGVIVLAAGILQKYGRTDRSGVTLAGGRRLGRGPHARSDIGSDHVFLDWLAEELQQWRSAAVDKGWSTDWSTFDRICSEAAMLANRKEIGEAYSHYGQAVHLLAGCLRSQQSVSSSDSSIEP